MQWIEKTELVNVGSTDAEKKKFTNKFSTAFAHESTGNHTFSGVWLLCSTHHRELPRVHLVCFLVSTRFTRGVCLLPDVAANTQEGVFDGSVNNTQEDDCFRLVVGSKKHLRGCINGVSVQTPQGWCCLRSDSTHRGV